MDYFIRGYFKTKVICRMPKPALNNRIRREAANLDPDIVRRPLWNPRSRARRKGLLRAKLREKTRLESFGYC